MDALGEVVSADDYDPWGMVLEGRSFNLADANPKYKFTGKELDIETGYLHFGQREYDPRIGRFNRVDRFASMYASVSPYVYALNNPMRIIDINGDYPDWLNDDIQKRLEANSAEHGSQLQFGLQFETANSDATRATAQADDTQESVDVTGAIGSTANAIEGLLLLTPEGHGLFVGKDGRMWNIENQPNGTTGPMRIPRATARLLTGVNTGAGVVQVAFAMGGLADAELHGSSADQWRARTDLLMTGASFIWPVGTVVAQTYFVTMTVVDHTIPYQPPPSCAPVRCHGAYQQFPTGIPK